MTLPYHPKRIASSGDPSSKLWIVGRWPGQKDFKSGYVLQGGAAMLFREAAKEVDFDIKSTFRTCIVPYFPPQGKIDRWVQAKKGIPK